MADTEMRVDNLETRVTTLEQNVNNVMTKLDMFIEESRAARERQDADIRELRQKHDADMQAMNKKIDDNVQSLRTEIQNLGGNFRTMNYTMIIGIAAMVIAILLK